jgi:hypothetical protein
MMKWTIEWERMDETANEVAVRQMRRNRSDRTNMSMREKEIEMIIDTAPYQPIRIIYNSKEVTFYVTRVGTVDALCLRWLSGM